MDPFSSEGELVNIHNAFHQAQYAKVISDFEPTQFSQSNHLPVQVLQYRAQLALGQYDDVLSKAKGETTTDLVAVRVLAEYLKDGASSTSASIQEAKKLSESESDNLGVQLCCGIVLARAGETELALALLSKHQGSLDAVALIVQIHLSLNHLPLAQKECTKARSFAQDALLVNLAESWVSLRQGGSQNYQSAYYVFEELAQAPSTASISSLVAQAVAELHLGRWEESESALRQAYEMEGGKEDREVLANFVVLNGILGKEKEREECRSKLEGKDGEYGFLRDLKEKRELFETARQKYTPKFEP